MTIPSPIFSANALRSSLPRERIVVSFKRNYFLDRSHCRPTRKAMGGRVDLIGLASTTSPSPRSLNLSGDSVHLMDTLRVGGVYTCTEYLW